MIVAEADDGYRFVTQPDHAALAGQFADHWGAGAFSRPRPAAAVAMAAHRHDDGWAAYDRRPRLDGSGGPVDFVDLPPATWTELYETGISSAVELDPYAGLLVSLHGAGLRRRRYGLSPEWTDVPPGFEAFVEGQQALQRRLSQDLIAADRLTAADDVLISALHEHGEPAGGWTSRLWRNYQRLQAWDVLSLSFCRTVDPPATALVGPVPRGRDGETETLTLEALGDDGYRVDPYPFDESPLSVTVPARTVRTDAFEDEAELAEAYYLAGWGLEEFRLLP